MGMGRWKRQRQKGKVAKAKSEKTLTLAKTQRPQRWGISKPPFDKGGKFAEGEQGGLGDEMAEAQSEKIALTRAMLCRTASYA